jgi:hypothetical protein
MTDYFELEEGIQNCWNVTTDIKDMCEAGAPVEDIKALATVYAYRFEKLWNTYESMIREKQFVSTEVPTAEQFSDLPPSGVDMSEAATTSGNGIFGVNLVDSDNQNVRLSYGIYDTDEGPQRILGIGRGTETLSSSINDLDVYINALTILKACVK